MKFVDDDDDDDEPDRQTDRQTDDAAENTNIRRIHGRVTTHNGFIAMFAIARSVGRSVCLR